MAITIINRKFWKRLSCLGLSLGLLTLAGCPETRTNTSYYKEKADISGKVYSPPESYDGLKHSTPEMFGLIFTCSHGAYGSEVDGNSWIKINIRDKIGIGCTDNYEETYDDLDDDGKKELIEKKLVETHNIVDIFLPSDK